MRILFIWGESLAKPGSGTVHCLGLASGLKACGHEITIITPWYGRGDLYCDNFDVRGIRLPARSVFSFVCFQILSVMALPVWLLRHRPDALYVRTCALQGVMSLICRVFKVPLVAEVDSLVDQEILQRGQPRWVAALALGLDRLNNRLCSGLVCVTRGLRDESIRRGGNADTTVAIPNGARTDVMQPIARLKARAELNLPRKAFLVGFAGYYAPWQGLDLLVTAAEKLGDLPVETLKLALMGKGQMEQQLRRWIRQRGLDERFIMLDAGPYEKVAKFLNACDAAVVPIHEPQRLRHGLSVLKFWDAVSVGLPVLVPERSELDNVLADLNLAGTFDPTSPASLAEAIRDLVQSGSLLLKKRRQVHRRVCRDYSWDAVGRKVSQYIEKL